VSTKAIAPLDTPTRRKVTIMTTRSAARRLVLSLSVAAFVAFTTLGPAPAASGAPQEFDAAAAYTAMKCGMCHSPKAEKAFDPAKPDDVLVAAILKGAKGAKPPHMPEYESKGIDEAKAKAFVEYMRKLREP
jgi:hypothetical protein